MATASSWHPDSARRSPRRAHADRSNGRRARRIVDTTPAPTPTRSVRRGESHHYMRLLSGSIRSSPHPPVITRAAPASRAGSRGCSGCGGRRPARPSRGAHAPSRRTGRR
jgi:hypothetical protein